MNNSKEFLKSLSDQIKNSLNSLELNSDDINNSIEEAKNILNSNFEIFRTLVNDLTEKLNKSYEENSSLIQKYQSIEKEFLDFKEVVSDEMIKYKDTIINAETVLEIAKNIKVSDLPKLELPKEINVVCSPGITINRPEIPPLQYSSENYNEPLPDKNNLDN